MTRQVAGSPGGSTLGPWVLGLWSIVVVLIGIQVTFARRRLKQPFATRVTPTGGLIAPAPPAGPAGPDTSSRRVWSGSAMAPTALGGMNATAPLAELSISDGAAVVRLRPTILSLMLGYQAKTLAPVDTEMILPVTRGRAKGVAMRPKGRPATFFFSGEAPNILSELERAGFPVDRHEQRVRLWGRAR